MMDRFASALEALLPSVRPGGQLIKRKLAQQKRAGSDTRFGSVTPARNSDLLFIAYGGPEAETLTLLCNDEEV